MKYMDSRLGAWQVGGDITRGAVQFKIFFPTGADPHVSSMRAVGSFQDAPWDFLHAPQLTRSTIAEGTLWSVTTPVELPAGFYEYKYLVTFDGGETRWVSDPCTRYGGSENQNAAVVIGGRGPLPAPPAGGRKPLRALGVYELRPDDFNGDFHGLSAPL